MLGVLLIDKPIGWTSHDVVGKLRRILNTKRIGHAGTLDPIATGLLVLAVGPATRFLQYLPLENKEYVATFRFGQETNTYDAEGEVNATAPVPEDLDARIAGALPAFLGEIAQLPPMFSAVKVAGQPLYKLARKGEEVERQERIVTLDEFTVVAREGDDVTFRIQCSGGTYVRTLAHDLGRAVGCGAHVASLVRSRVGKFALEDASSLADASSSRMIPLARALEPMPRVELSDDDARYVREGRPLGIRGHGGARKMAMIDPRGEVVGIGRVDHGLLHPECVIPAEASS